MYAFPRNEERRQFWTAKVRKESSLGKEKEKLWNPGRGAHLCQVKADT
jgi:hypothetical protein